MYNFQGNFNTFFSFRQSYPDSGKMNEQFWSNALNIQLNDQLFYI